jgi:SAM-dependent methyltransferase
MGMLRSLAAPVTPGDRVLDFGCGYGLFLQLLYEIHPFAEGVGVDRDRESVDRATAALANKHPDWPIRYLRSDQFAGAEYAEGFDHIFAQEILWMNADLAALASELFALLKPDGRCYCTMGSHADNPLWPHRRERMERDGETTYTWSVDQVGDVFSKAGFAVGVRRLPIEGFIMYHPEATPVESRSLYELVQTTSECKMLFYFGKHAPVGRPTRLQG